MPGLVSIGIGDPIQIQIQVRENSSQYRISPANLVNSAWPSLHRRNEYQPTGSDALQLESEGRYTS